MFKQLSLVTLLAGSLAVASSAVYAKNFKVAVGDAAGSAQHAMGVKFAEELAANSDHTAELFVNGQLGSEQDTINDAAIGVFGYVFGGNQ